MKHLGQLKVMYIGMFIVMLLRSVSSTPITSRTGRMKRERFEGKPEGTRPIVSLGVGWAKCLQGRQIEYGRGRKEVFSKLYNRLVSFCAIHEGKINLRYFERKAHQPVAGFQSSILVKSEFGILVPVEGGKPANPEKTLGTKREPTTNSTYATNGGNLCAYLSIFTELHGSYSRALYAIECTIIHYILTQVILAFLIGSRLWSIRG